MQIDYYNTYQVNARRGVRDVYNTHVRSIACEHTYDRVRVENMRRNTTTIYLSGILYRGRKHTHYAAQFTNTDNS